MQDEYATLAQGMRLGTLKVAAEEPPMVTWISQRFTHSHMSTHGPGLAPGFGEQVDSAIRSSVAYSFGHCSRKDATKVYVSKEISKGENIGPGPVGATPRLAAIPRMLRRLTCAAGMRLAAQLAYKIPTSIGPKGTATTVSGRAPLYGFGTDPIDALHRTSTELRELKASGLDVSKELTDIRTRVHRVAGGGTR